MKWGDRRALLRNLAYGFAALVLAGGWIYFYAQSRSVDLDAAVEAFATLEELRAIDGRLNDRLLQARHPLPAAAPPTPDTQSIARLHARLKLQIFRFTTRIGGRELDALRQAFEEKTGLVARYSAADFDPSREALFERAWLSSTGPRLDQVTRYLQLALGEAVGENALYRMFLLYYSGFLVVVLGYFIWGLASSRMHIDRVNRQLREANESLEARVEERTRELSDALAKLKESEVLLIQSEKMSSLGRMVAGIAHEINTPLAYVKASLEAVRGRTERNSRLADETDALLSLLAAENPDPSRLETQFAQVRDLVEALRAGRADEEIGKALEDGLYGIGQIAEIVSNLKDFSRLDRSKVAQYDLRAGLESTLRIARDHIKTRQVRKDFGPIPKVSCSPSQINQVFLNLIVNAAQATAEETGVIILSSGTTEDGQVWVDIIDNGHGIPTDVLPKIFDPFFTTKEVGKGTGLGLSICYKIVQNHGGKLEVESQVGVGTRFRVILPATQTAVAATA